MDWFLEIDEWAETITRTTWEDVKTALRRIAKDLPPKAWALTKKVFPELKEKEEMIEREEIVKRRRAMRPVGLFVARS